ncbi:MAG: peptidylprolyl isomerase [Clostridiales Family XIII bacterium]|nr:peptidylprolyl isomerase [Clostridiales Family XIII bacterium]
MNKLMKKAMTFALCLTLIFALASCGKSKGEVLAEVGSSKIYEKQVDGIVNLLAIINSIDISTWSDEEREEIRNSTLIYMVESELIRGNLKGSDIVKDEKKTVDDQIESLMGSGDIKTQLDDAGITNDVLRYFLEANYYSQSFIEKVSEDDPVSDEEVLSYFNENEASFVSPSAIQVSHILMGGPELKDEDRTAIEALRERALAGEDFATLAKENSLDPGTKDLGGDLGFVPKGWTTPLFEEAAFALKNGEISEVIETEFGFHIIKAFSDLIEERPMTLEESTPTIEGVLKEEHAKKALEKLKEESDIRYFVDVDPSTGEPYLIVPKSADEGETDGNASGSPDEGDTDGSSGDEQETE